MRFLHILVYVIFSYGYFYTIAAAGIHSGVAWILLLLHCVLVECSKFGNYMHALARTGGAYGHYRSEFIYYIYFCCCRMLKYIAIAAVLKVEILSCCAVSQVEVFGLHTLLLYIAVRWWHILLLY